MFAKQVVSSVVLFSLVFAYAQADLRSTFVEYSQLIRFEKLDFVYFLEFILYLKLEVVLNPIARIGHHSLQQMVLFVRQLDRLLLSVLQLFEHIVMHGMQILVLKETDGIQWNYGQEMAKYNHFRAAVSIIS